MRKRELLQERSDGLVRVIVEFCRFARANGLGVGVKETIDSLEAARTVRITDREAFKFALRAVLCSSKQEWDLFDHIFEVFWSGAEHELQAASHTGNKWTVNSGQWTADRSEFFFNCPLTTDHCPLFGEDGGKAVSGASVYERLKKTDFSRVPHSDLASLEQLSLRLLRQMSVRLSRKLKIMQSRGPVDLRRTIRRSIGRGGDPLDLSYKGKKTQPVKLVTLLDVSGSMELYSVFLLKFVYALQKHFTRVDSFMFSTRLVNITDALRTQLLPAALMALSQTEAGWSGGTKIGESLRDFNRLYGGKLLSRDTLFVIFSDGWDTGEPQVLAGELSAIKRRVRKLIWLNPLLGLDNYQPMTRGMSAALPYIDVFAAAHNLESLLELERHLKPSLFR